MSDKKTVAERLDGIQGALTERHDEMKGLLDKQAEELKTTKTTSAETAKAMEAANAAIDQLNKDIKGVQEQYVEELGKHQKRVDEIETQLGRMNVPGAQPDDPDRKTAGQMFVESEAYKDFKAALERGHTPKQSGGVTVEQLTKAGELSTTTATRFSEPRRDDFVGEQRRVLRVRNLIPAVPYDRSSVEYLEQTGFHDGTTIALTSAITETGEVATVTTVAAHGLKEGDLVRLAGQVPTGYIGDWYVTGVPTTTTFTFDVGATVADSTTHGTWFQLDTGSAKAAWVAELNAAGQSQLEYTLRSETMRKVSHYIEASRESLQDVGFLQNEIDVALAYALDYKEDEDLLYGDGVAPNIQGIMAHARVLDYSWSEGLTAPIADTKLDAIRRAATLAHKREFMPTGVVIGSAEWEAVETAKASDGQYIWVQVPDGGGPRVWRMAVAETNAMADGEALVGAFALGARIYDRRQVEIRVTESHGDNFPKEINLIYASKRMVAAWRRPDAFVKVTFDAAPS